MARGRTWEQSEEVIRCCSLIACAGVLFGAVACSSSSPTVSTTDFPASPLMTVTSKSGALSVALWTSPNQPPVAGPAAAQLTVTNVSTGEPATGLTVSVVPWMPAMGHGQAFATQVSETDAGTGTYTVTNIDLIMPGEWALETSFTGPVTDSVSPTFSVH